MAFLTFKQLKDGDVPGRIGVCPESDTFRDYTNKATRMLMNRGQFWGTVVKMRLCVYNSCLVWPRIVGTPLAVNINGHPSEVFNHWYEFQPITRADFHYGGGFVLSGNTCVGNLQTINDGVSPVFNPISCNRPMYVRAYPSTLQDVGKKTRIFGIDENGLVIRTQNVDLTWTDGVELTLAMPFISTPFKIREITRITKDETEGTLRYYQYDADNAVLLDLVWYEPDETSPMYRRSRLHKHHGTQGGCCATSQTCGGLSSVEAMVKLEFVPVKKDSDMVLISNEDALSDMMLAVKYSNAGDAAMAKDFEAKSIHELNLELENKIPQDQTVVTINPFGSALPDRHCIGSII